MHRFHLFPVGCIVKTPSAKHISALRASTVLHIGRWFLADNFLTRLWKESLNTPSDSVEHFIFSLFKHLNSPNIEKRNSENRM